MQGILTNIQRFSMHDGPGVRTTLFFKGCPLRCLWCHNPETLAFGPALTHDPDKCIGCGSCLAACPSGALSLADGALRHDPAACGRCFACVAACPARALSITGRAYTVQEALTEALRDRGMYARTGGGVTLSGGEATAQPAFALALMQALRQEGIHVALDTCGLAATESFLTLCRAADLILYDLKHTDDARHEELTGQPFAPIRRHFLLLGQEDIPVQVRIPLMPGLNDDEDTQRAFAALIREQPRVTSVVLLGYHALGQSKLYGFGQVRPIPAIQPPRKEHLAVLAERMAALTGLPCTYR